MELSPDKKTGISDGWMVIKWRAALSGEVPEMIEIMD
jgi:hypothetical protein